MIPCKTCPTLAICRQKKIVQCILVDDYSFLHDHDPGDRGAKKRSDYVAECLFGEDLIHLVILDRTLRTATLAKGTQPKSKIEDYYRYDTKEGKAR